ncbi:MAG: hypothetical protein CSA60_03275 [Neptuniibacter caesariensis]|uniref:Permease n=1 Tax=Neptuniibacter caesariensis TaxID=207954 RepID=A0A2G6JLB8_NEPCE|nr:MAG: hypothetical protein CSA60_03275 [Neptuniibacter caesariensis]
MAYLQNLLHLSLESAPWLVLGLMVAGIIKAFMKDDWLARQLGNNGIGAVTKSALIGAPLPLCSCSVIPVVIGIRRSGASKSATVSFLVATPETGADSIALSYAMMGPLMAIARPIAAIFSAIFSGILVAIFDKEQSAARTEAEHSGHTHTSADSCCGSPTESPTHQHHCCQSHTAHDKDHQTHSNLVYRLKDGLVFAFTSIFDGFIKWLFIGLLFAALVKTFVPESFLLEWGSGLVAMLVMMAVGIPMYICATASTPIAAALMLAGISPGTALVFLLAGPATNMATLAVISQELGNRSLVLYLLGMVGASLFSGLALDKALDVLNVDVTAQLSASHDMLPAVLTWFCLGFLLVLTAISLKKQLQNHRNG